MEKRLLLGLLPAFTNQSVLIEKRQAVKDIIREVLAAHEVFASDYDKIAAQFYCGSPKKIAQALFNFCKQNIRYKVEPEERQTTKSPAAILALGDSVGGDCKHYAGFIGGVLDALNRKGCPIEWHYRFASYDMFDRTPQHVFIVVNDQGNEIWVDPVLGSFDQKLQPYHSPIDKRPKTVSNMPLFRISGIATSEAGLFQNEFALPVTEQDVIRLAPAALPALEQEQLVEEINPELQAAIDLLLQYRVLNEQGQVSDLILSQLSKTLPTAEFEAVSRARQTIQVALNQGAIGSVFSDIWRGIKKTTLAVPRNAYLSLVALNIFGFATKLKNAIYKADGSFFQPNQDKLYRKWHSLGGDWQNLRNAITSGAKKKAILGAAECNTVGVAPAVVPAWVATASAIIAALTPLIKDLLTAKNQAGQLEPGIDPSTGLPAGIPGANYPSATGGSIMDWISQNPITTLAIGAGATGAVLLLTKKGRR